MEVNTLLLAMQPHFQEELQANLEKFRVDSEEYICQYKTCGPMSPGLSPREASDRLIMFQVSKSLKIKFLSNYFKFNFLKLYFPVSQFEPTE